MNDAPVSETQSDSAECEPYPLFASMTERGPQRVFGEDHIVVSETGIAIAIRNGGWPSPLFVDIDVVNRDIWVQYWRLGVRHFFSEVVGFEKRATGWNTFQYCLRIKTWRTKYIPVSPVYDEEKPAPAYMEDVVSPLFNEIFALKSRENVKGS